MYIELHIVLVVNDKTLINNPHRKRRGFEDFSLKSLCARGNKSPAPPVLAALKGVELNPKRLKRSKNSKNELFSMNLWEAGNYYNIANKTLLDKVFFNLTRKIEEYLIPQIRKLET
jgi:hypothetical protein